MPDGNYFASVKVGKWLKLELGVIYGYFLGYMHCDKEFNLTQEQIDAEVAEALADRGYTGTVDDFESVIQFLIDEEVVSWREAISLEMGED